MKAVAPVNPSSDPAVDATGQEALVVTFPAGIPGFETCRRFVVIASPEIAPLAWLKALDPPEASFLTIDPRLVDREYDLTLREFERGRLAAGDDPLVWLSLVTVTGDKATVNLRAPIVINPRRMIGCQFIRDDRDYPVHFPLGQA